jgi:HSP20 family protein
MASRVNNPGPGRESSERHYPFATFRVFEDMLNDWAARSESRREWAPSANILEKDENLILQIEVPGLNEKEISLKMEGNVLTVKGERKGFEGDGYTYHQQESPTGPFARSFTLPDSVDPENIKANCKNGVLTIAIPQRPEVRSRTIKVNG